MTLEWHWFGPDFPDCHQLVVSSIKEMSKIIESKGKVFAADEEEEEELVDPQTVLREECKDKHCLGYEKRLNECNDRVNSRSQTAETCMEEIIDLMHCVDHCASKTLFSKLK